MYVAFILLLVLIIYPGHVHAAEPPNAAEVPVTTLDDIKVTSEKILLPTRQADETVYTGTEITTKGIEAQGARAATSVYEAMSVLPGINVQSADQYGLGAEQRNIRVRGVSGYMGALTVEGVPNYGGNPIGPRDYLYDMENIQSIAVYKGAVPGDIGTGVGSRGGAIVLKPLWAEEEFGLRLSQSLGSDAYHRTFLRVDTGSLAKSETRLSASCSYSRADKWKGPGEIGPRNNFNMSLVQSFGEKVNVRAWLNHNELDQNLFRPLDINQANDLSTYRDFDYNSRRTGVPKQDIHYYDYNKGHYKNTDILGTIDIHPSTRLKLSLKPYLTMEDTHIYQGVMAGGGQVRKRERAIDRTGIIIEGTWKSRWLTSVAGYLFENSDMQITSRNYAITSDGLAYRGYGIIATSGNSRIHSPYLKVSGNIQRLDWQAGLKLFHFEDPASKGYATNPVDYSLERAPDLDRKARDYNILLPTAGAGYRLSDSVYIHASYGKNFIRPYAYMPIINLYNNNRAVFQAATIGLDDLFAGYDMEESDSFDLGVRFTTAWFDIAPTLFYAKHKNLLTTVYDPRVNLSYNQNVGKATGYGLDLESNFYLHDNLTLFINPTYAILEYDEDITYQGQNIASKNHQVVDTPEIMVRCGVIFNWKNLEIIPTVRYTGKRYGDVRHQEKIASFTVVDLRATYSLRNIFFENDIKLSFDLMNIFDKKYVSNIIASDYDRGGNASYYAGAPFSAVFSAAFRF